MIDVVLEHARALVRASRRRDVRARRRSRRRCAPNVDAPDARSSRALASVARRSTARSSTTIGVRAVDDGDVRDDRPRGGARAMRDASVRV